MPSQYKVSKEWWSIDQDEWTNSLSLGSDPGHRAVPDTNPDYEPESSLDAGYESGPEPELRSLDQLIELKTENRGAERKGVSTRKSSWNQFVWGRRS